MHGGRNVFLVGMMGAGKSTAGRLMARRLRRPFHDSDHEVERRCGVSIPVIFEIEGEAGFRAREAAVLAELTALENVVLATGGGAVLAEANRRLLAAIWRLAWLRPEGQPLTRVNWRDMETEELGSVYEGLLELTPRASADARSFAFAEGDETRGHARKTTGSYYTPEALVKLLLDSTFVPVLDAAEARDPEDPIAGILKLSIIDPACGSGHFLLASARRAADRIAKLRSPGAPSQVEFQRALREVVSNCIHGVDRNPLAVELCKVALWIEALEPGKPLTFLDARIRCGDSLIVSDGVDAPRRPQRAKVRCRRNRNGGRVHERG